MCTARPTADGSAQEQRRDLVRVPHHVTGAAELLRRSVAPQHPDGGPAELAAACRDEGACEWAAERMTTAAADMDVPFQTALAGVTTAWRDVLAGRHEAAVAAGTAAAEILRTGGYRALSARATLAAAAAAYHVDDGAAADLTRAAGAALRDCGAVWRERQLLAELRRRGRAADVATVLGVQALTPREHEIAALVTRRRTTAEIAAHLSISRRTVESHLLSIYTKLGVHSRDDLCRVVAAR